MTDPLPIAFRSAETIKQYQETQLQRLLRHLQEHSPFYQRWFRQHQVDIFGIHTLEDLQRIPPVEKEQLQSFNDEFCCVPRNHIIEYTATSGTLGTPVTVALTENDLERLADNELQSFRCADGHADDLYQLMLTLDRQFMAGMAY